MTDIPTTLFWMTVWLDREQATGCMVVSPTIANRLR